MNPLFWLDIVVTAFTAYQVGRFITLRNLAKEAKEFIAQFQRDNQTGNPIGQALAREMDIEL